MIYFDADFAGFYDFNEVNHITILIISEISVEKDIDKFVLIPYYE